MSVNEQDIAILTEWWGDAISGITPSRAQIIQCLKCWLPLYKPAAIKEALEICGNQFRKNANRDEGDVARYSTGVLKNMLEQGEAEEKPAALAAAPVCGPTNPLVGKYFMTLAQGTADLSDWLGHVVAEISPGVMLVHFRISEEEQLLSVSDMKGWKFYSTEPLMFDAFAPYA